MIRALFMAGVVAAWAGLSTGCGGSPGTPRYETLTGVVIACKAETGELLVRTGMLGEAAETQCQVTRDSELYINDGLAQIEELRAGDAVELIGYRDDNASIARFVVSRANVSRAVRWPKPPVAPDDP